MRRLASIVPVLLACSSLTGCNSGLAGILAASSDSGSTTNAPSSISGMALTGAETSPATLSFRLVDAESDGASVTLRYQVAGQEPQELTQLGGADNPQVYGSSSQGLEHQVSWDFAAEPGLPADGSYTPEVTVWASLQENQPVTPGVNAVVGGLGNDAPLVGRIEVPGEETVGIVPVTFEVSDSSSDLVDVRVEFTVEGSGTWTLARPGGLDHTPDYALTDVTALAGGTSLIFFWDTNHDLPSLESDARLRFTPVDPTVEGTGAISPVFRVDNNEEALLTLDNGLVVLEAQDFVGGIALPFKLLDPEGDDVRVVFQWAESSQPFPDLPIHDPAQVFAIQDDPALRAEYQVCSLRHNYMRGNLVPVDATHARLPALGTDRSPIETAAYRGRALEILRPKIGWTDLGAQWSSSTLTSPVAALPIGDGLEAWVLDAVGAGSWEVRRVELATGAVLESLASGTGAPRALARATGGQALFVGSTVGSQWRIDRIDGVSGARLEFALGPFTAQPGLRGLAADTDRSAFFSVDEDLMRVEFLDGGPQARVLRTGLAEPWGVALDPLDRNLVVVAEHGADRVVEYDWKRDRLADVLVQDPTPEPGASGPPFEKPRAVAFEWRGKRLLVATESATEGARLMALDRRSAHDLDADGLADPLVFSVGDLPADAGDALATGHEGLRLLPVPTSGSLGAIGGIEQRRTITQAAAGDNLIEVDAAFHPPITPHSQYRVDRATHTFQTTPDPESYVFSWDSRDVSRTSTYLFRAVPFDSEAGIPGSTDLERPVTSSFGARSVVLDDNPNGDDIAPLAVDFDTDGDLDVLVYAGAASRLHLQESPGQFAAAPDLGGIVFGPTMGTPPLVEDLNGDGLVDVAHWREDRQIEVFRGTGHGTFDPVPELLAIPFTEGSIDHESWPRQACLTSCDLDADGDLDLLATLYLNLEDVVDPPAEPQQGVIVYHQGESGLFDVPPIVVGDPALSVRLRQIVPADLDGDGLVDLVVAVDGGLYLDPWLDRGRVFAYFQDATGAFDPEPLGIGNEVEGYPGYYTTSKPASIALEDFDHDGDLDVAVAIASSDAHIGGFLVGEEQTIRIHWQTAPRQFDPEATVLEGAEAPGIGDFEALAAADVNGDGLQDILAQGEGGLHVHFMVEPGSFLEPPLTLAYGGSAKADDYKRSLKPLQLQDIDGDGDLDVVLDNWYTNQVELRLQIGAGLEGFHPDPLHIQISGVTDGAIVAVAEDFDGDGDLDLATSNGGISGLFAPNNWQVFSQTAPRTFTSLPHTVGGAPEIQAAGWIEGADVDGDGDRDLVASDLEASELLIFHQEPGGLAGPPVVLPTPPGNNPSSGGYNANYPSFVLTEDLDLDGDLDLLPLPWTEMILPFYVQDERGAFQEAFRIAPLDEQDDPISNKPRAARTLDWNGDGILDLAVATDGTYLGTLLIYEASAPGVFGTEPTGLGEGESRQLYVEDVDGNGVRDLIASTWVNGAASWGLRMYMAQEPGQFEVTDVPAELGNPSHLVGAPGMFFVDVDEDGDLDLIHLSHYEPNVNNSFALRYQVAPGRFSEPRELIPGSGLIAGVFDLQDVDGDGDLDLLFSFFYFQAETKVFWGNG